MKKLSIPLILFLFLLLLSQVSLAVPHYINYQGVLRYNNGDLVNADLPMIFGIYASPESINPIWEEEYNTTTELVEVRDGLFNVSLGKYKELFEVGGNPVFDGNPKFLGVTIGGEPLEGRIPLISVPYAYNAEYLQNLAPGDFVRFGPSQPQQTDSVNGIDIDSTNSDGYAGHFTGGRGIYADGITTRIREIDQSPYDLQNNDSVIFLATGGNVTINLPATSDKTLGKVYYFYNVNTAVINIEFKVANTSTETINNAASYTAINVLPFHGAWIVGRNSTSWVISLF